MSELRIASFGALVFLLLLTVAYKLGNVNPPTIDASILIMFFGACFAVVVFGHRG